MTITRYPEPVIEAEKVVDIAFRRRRARRRLVVVGLCLATLVAAALVGRGQPTTKPEPKNAAMPQATNNVAPASTQNVPHNVAGVPVGYPRTPPGAESAAVNYAVAYGSAAMFEPAARHAIIDAIAAPPLRNSLQTQLDANFAAVSASFGLDAGGKPSDGLQFVARTLPVGVRTVSFNNDRAVAEVWTAGIVGLAGKASTKPVAEAWATITISLVWAENDWKWESFTQQDGPTPVSGLQPPSGAEAIADATASFAGFRYVR